MLWQGPCLKNNTACLSIDPSSNFACNCAALKCGNRSFDSLKLMSNRILLAKFRTDLHNDAINAFGAQLLTHCSHHEKTIEYDSIARYYFTVEMDYECIQ